MTTSDFTGDHERATADGDGWPMKVTKAVAALVVIGAVALGANALAKDNSAVSGSGGGQGFGGPGGPGGAGGPGVRGGAPGMGGQVSSATLAKLTKVVTAKYPGTVERAFQVQDGSYLVGVARTGGSTVLVRVDKDFAITGAFQPGARGGTGPGAAPGSGTTGGSPGAPGTTI